MRVKEFGFALLQWLENLGYLGILVGLMVEVIPSEIVLSYGGYLVSAGQIGFIGAVAAGTVGGTLAQLFLYWLGRYGGRPFLDKYGKYLLIGSKHIDISERWFKKYGSGVIFAARFIPVVRHAISIPAGIARMPLVAFTLYTVLAVIPWSIFFIYLGMQLGDNWREIGEMSAPYIKPVMIAAAALILLYLGWKQAGKRLTKRREDGPPARSASMRETGLEAGNSSDSGRAGDGPENRAGGLKHIAGAASASLEGLYLLRGGRIGKPGGDGWAYTYLAVGPVGVHFLVSPASTAASGIQWKPELLYRYEYALKDLLRKHGMNAAVNGAWLVEAEGFGAAAEGYPGESVFHSPEQWGGLLRRRQGSGRLTRGETGAIAELLVREAGAERWTG